MRNNTLRFSFDFNRYSKSPDQKFSKALKLQVIDLQTINQGLRERNRILERQIEELNTEISGLLKLNRKLASSYGSAQLQDLEQVCEGIYKKQMNDAFEQIEKLQLELNKFGHVVQILREENSELKTRLLQYRKHVAQLSSSQEIPVYLPTTVEVPKTILDSFQSFRKCRSVSEVFQKITESLSSISSCALFFVHSPQLCKLYNKHFPDKERMRVGRMNLIVDGDLSQEKAFFMNKDEVLNPVQTSNYIISPGYIHKDLDYIIQISKPTKARFTENDLMLVSLITQYSNKVLKILQLRSQEAYRKSHLQATLNLIGKLVTAKSLESFSNLVDEHLASLFDFQEAGIVFTDYKVNQLFIYGYSAKPNIKFCDEVIRFPENTGFTGEVLKGSGIRIIENLKNKAGFHPEVDNIASTGDIRQCVMIKLAGPDGLYTGVLQLNNKISGKISQSDLKSIQELAPVLGHIIFGISNIENALDLTFKMKNSLFNLQH